MPTPIFRWKQSLALRPLLWIAPAVMIGCALGAAWAQFLEYWLNGNATRALPVLWFPFAAMALLAVLCWRWQQQQYFWLARTAAALALAAGFCGYGARRILPAPNDVSQLVRGAEITARLQPGNLRVVPVVLQGYVAAAPHVGDFDTEFPLESTLVQVNGKALPLQGDVWVQAPPDWQAQVGDLVEIRAGLRDLPRPGAAVETNRDWHYLLNDCWSMVHLGKGDAWRILPGARPWRWQAAYQLGHLRQWLLAVYQRRFKEEGISYPAGTAQLLVAMVFGDGALSAPLPPLVRNDFRAAGLTHLLVASGTQVSLLVLLILGIFKWCGLRRFPWLMLAVLLPLLAVYALLAGGAASIWRAFIAGICVAVALVLGRSLDLLSLWCLAAAALLAIDPLQIFDLSFQLTFAATWGLIVVAPALLQMAQARAQSAFARGALSVGVYTVAAQLATLPLLMYHFGRFSLAGLGTNLVALPVSGVLVGSGIAGIGIPWLTPLNAYLTQFIFSLTALAGSFDWIMQRGVTTSLMMVCCCYLALMALPGWEEVRLIAGDEWQTWKNRAGQRWGGLHWRRALVGGIALAAMVWAVSLAWGRNAGLNVALLDVGQGECIVIRAPSGRTILIDGGSLTNTEHGDVGQSVILPYLAAHGVRRLDAVMLTHSDSDHCNALDEVAAEIPVGLFVDGSGEQKTSGQIAEPDLSKTDYWRLVGEMDSLKVPHRMAQAGQQLQLGDGVTLQILSPQRPALADSNNHSMVAKLIYGKTSFLLTGDMEAEEENQLVRRGADLRCTILKVAHHGSATSSTAAFLRAAHPAAAIISCGRYNPFGHPASSTLDRLKQFHIPWFRTDLDGTIEIHSNGERCWIKTFR